MLTTICAVRQGDRHATARVSTASPQQNGEVYYEGDLDLFPCRYAYLRNDDLCQLARTIAHHDEAAIARWRDEDWPRLQKKRENKKLTLC